MTQRSRPELREAESRRDATLDRFLVASDELLTALAGDRDEAHRAAAWRPVMLVVALFLVLIFVHVLLVERPEIRARRRRRSHEEFAEAMQVARSEAEAYDVLSHHVERVSAASRVVVLNRNNSADRLEAVTPVEAGCPTAQGSRVPNPTPASRFAWRGPFTAPRRRPAVALRRVRAERGRDDVRAIARRR